MGKNIGIAVFVSAIFPSSSAILVVFNAFWHSTDVELNVSSGIYVLF